MLTFPAVDVLKTLDEITADDRPVVGGKAYNCARLKQAGFPVPDGLVVSADATDEEVAAVADHPWLQTVPAGTLFAVRSSGIAEDSEGDSFARRNASASTPKPGAAGPDIEWTRANLAEVLPDQLCPQALDVYVNLLARAERAFFGRLMAPESELGPIIKAFHGRLYFNLSQLRHVTTTIGERFADLLRSLGHAEQIRPEDEIAPKPALKKLLPALPDVARLAIADLRIAHVFHEHQVRTEHALARLTAVDPSTVSDRDIWAQIQWWLDMGPEWLAPVFVMSSVQNRVKAIRKACERVGFPYEQLLYPQLAAGERSVSSQQAFDLVALAEIARQEPKATTYLRSAATFDDFRTAVHGTRFLKEFEQFLARYGHRGRYESDWSIPRMHENPTPVLFAMREQLSSTADDPATVAKRQSAAAAEAWRAFEARLTGWQKYTLLPRVRIVVRQLKQQYVWRERVRSDITRVASALRVWHLTLADRFVRCGCIDRRDDYFLLCFDEVQRACENSDSGSGLRAIAARRAEELAAQRDLQMPLFMRESELPALLAGKSSADVADGNQLTGLCTSPGEIEAEVVVMRDPSEFATMKRGAILVAPATDPSWTPLFTLASGVIVEVGGLLSHASTIAREYGLPALANVKNATRVLRTGERVRLEASAGRVVRC